MNICGVLVHARPERAAEIAVALERIPGLELHGHADGGRIVVTLEDTQDAAAIDGLSAIHRLPGVVSAALVYHQFEPDQQAGAASTQSDQGA